MKWTALPDEPEIKGSEDHDPWCRWARDKITMLLDQKERLVMQCQAERADVESLTARLGAKKLELEEANKETRKSKELAEAHERVARHLTERKVSQVAEVGSTVWLPGIMGRPDDPVQWVAVTVRVVMLTVCGVYYDVGYWHNGLWVEAQVPGDQVSLEKPLAVPNAGLYNPVGTPAKQGGE